MISILIPTYNYVCEPLVRQLQVLCEQVSCADSRFSYEILVADDASTKKEVVEQNAQIACLPHCRYLQQTENMGRARIRNFLAEQAVCDYLLFIDSDAQVADELFIQNYWNAISLRCADVVCGGVANVPVLTDEAYSLRYYYEENVGDGRLASVRMQHPYAHFTTFNFLIKRSLFLQIRFDDDCVHYGYEDVLFGMNLEQLGVSVSHIDNALIHAGLEPNAVFLRKTETALETLYGMDRSFKEYVRVSRVALTFERFHLLPLLSWFYRCFSKMMRRRLLCAKPSIFLFNIYKLTYYASLEHRFRK